jgi:hypothetical protein
MHCDTELRDEVFLSSSSTSQLGLSTDQLNDGVTMRINTSNHEDFAFAAAGSLATPPPHLLTT